MDRGKVFVCLGVPVVVSAVLMAMYFSGLRIFETIISMPYFEALHSNSRREFGLVENIQNLLLVAILVVTCRAAVQHRAMVVRLAFGSIFAGTLFMFLEEIDYGLHVYEVLTGVPPEETAKRRNFHNVDGRTGEMKRIGDVLMILYFAIAPFAMMRSSRPLIRYFRPDPYLVLTVIAASVMPEIGHKLDDRGLGVGLQGNISEFREVITYYLVLLYTLDLSNRSLDGPPVAAQSVVVNP